MYPLFYSTHQGSVNTNACDPQASIDATGSPLTDEALNAAKNADAVLLGAIGGPVREPPPSTLRSHKHPRQPPTNSQIEMGNRRRPP